MNTPINLGNDNVLRALKESLNAAMLKAAEPAIQQALKDIERDMREKLAQRLIGLLEQNLSIERYGRDLRVTIRQVLKD